MNVRRLLTLATLVFLAGCAAPIARSEPSGTPTGVPQPSVTASPTPSPSGPISTASPAAGAIAIDGFARSTVDDLVVRAKPGTAGTPLGTINAEQPGFVVAGPISADGYAWYQLSGLGLPLVISGCEYVKTHPFNCPDWLGWVAAGEPGGQPWLEAIQRSCAPSPMNLDALVNGPAARGPRTALELLACYRSSPIRVRAWWPQIPPGGLGGTCGPPSPVAWLVCQNINYNGLVISETAGFEGVGLKISIDPASGVTMPRRGQWVEVVGHLDDPAARDCAPLGGGEEDPVRVVLTCRTQLVAESVNPVAGPY